MNDSRTLALQIFDNITSQKQPFQMPTDIAVNDIAFVRMLVMTSLRHLPYIEQTINSLSSQKKSKSNLVKNILTLGACELLYMQSPDYAVINSYVNIAKKHLNRFTSGFINAVLRNISRQKAQLQQADHGHFFNQTFKKLLQPSYDAQTIELIEKSSISEPLLDITVVDSSSPIYELGQQLPLGTLRLKAKGKINELPDYDKGVWWVQDFSSSMPVKLLDNLKGKNVLDLCAAPGGKTAQLLSAGAIVTAVDISAPRLQTLQQNLQRLKLSPQNIICADAIDYLSSVKEKYDVILLDAPCSATGTIRRHPEIVQLKTYQDVVNQSLLQSQILKLVPNALKPHGYIVYCTCSLCREEGEEQIINFLAANPTFNTIDLTSKLPDELKNLADSHGFIRILPHYLSAFGNADGFFIACLQSSC